MERHPGHFWICLLMLFAMISVSIDLSRVADAIKENTAAVRALAK